MFDTEDSDCSVDNETLAWIDQYPELVNWMHVLSAILNEALLQVFLRV